MENLKQGSTFSKVSESFWVSLNLSKATFKNFRVWEENNVKILILNTKQMSFLFYNFDPRLWNCYNATMNSPYLMFFSKLMQRFYHVVILTSKRQCKLDIVFATLYSVAITASMICSEVNLLSNFEETLA